MVAHVRVEALQLPGTHRRELANRCQAAVCDTVELQREHSLAA
jgi:hypothetical protein